MSRKDVPGGWVDIHEPRKVTERKRRKYVEAMGRLTEALGDIAMVDNPDKPGQTMPDPKAPLPPGALSLFDEANDALIVALVTAWAWGDVTTDALLDMPIDAVDAIRDLCLPLAEQMMPNYEVTPDPKVSTNGSSSTPTVSAAAN